MKHVNVHGKLCVASNITFGSWAKLLASTARQYWNSVAITLEDTEIVVYYYNPRVEVSQIGRVGQENSIVSDYEYNIGHAEYQEPPINLVILASYDMTGHTDVSKRGNSLINIIEGTEEYLDRVGKLIISHFSGPDYSDFAQ